MYAGQIGPPGASRKGSSYKSDTRLVSCILEIYFFYSDEHPRLFYMGVSPGVLIRKLYILRQRKHKREISLILSTVRAHVNQHHFLGKGDNLPHSRPIFSTNVVVALKLLQ